MDRFRPRLSYANVMATVAVFIALGGGALAATSFVGSDGKIRGCVSKKGQLTLVKPGKHCKKGTPIAWNSSSSQPMPARPLEAGPAPWRNPARTAPRLSPALIALGRW